MSYFHLTKTSANKKLGSFVAASTSSADTCSNYCPFKQDGSCYAMHGPQSWHWAKVSSGERGSNWWEFCAQVLNLKPNQLFRVNVSGDLPTNEDGLIDEVKLFTLINCCELQELRAWTYTHHHLNTRKNSRENLAIIKASKSKHLTINLSCEDRYQAANYQQEGFNVSIVDDDLFELLRDGYQVKQGTTKFVACPEQLPNSKATCSTCKLCTRSSSKRPVVVFKQH